MSYPYLLDANTYIQAKNLYYRMHIVPGYWDWLDQQLDNAQAGSIRLVYDELAGYGDELSAWVRARRERFLPESDEATQQAFSDIANYVMSHPIYTELHAGNFLAKADAWLIAKAMTTGAEVVTHEERVADNSSKVKIPNVCRHFGVKYRNTYDLMDTLRMTLILQP